MLHEGVAATFRSNVARLAGVPGVRTLLDQSQPGTPGFRSGAVVLAVDVATAVGAAGAAAHRVLRPGRARRGVRLGG